MELLDKNKITCIVIISSSLPDPKPSGNLNLKPAGPPQKEMVKVALTTADGFLHLYDINRKTGEANITVSFHVCFEGITAACKI